MQVASLQIYPIKSLGGFSPDVAIAMKRGFEHDRRWMLVDQEGHFISQRTYPELAQFFAEVEGDNLILRHHNKDDTLVIEEANNVEKPAITVQVWQDTFHARNLGNQVNKLVSDYLNFSCRLVYMGPQDVRRIKDDPSQNVSFADGYPYLITNTASIQDLSEKHGSAISMDRFRPNIVIECDSPWIEDHWKKLKIDGIEFHIDKPCARCQVPGIDQTTGKTDETILKTFAQHRRQGKQVLFGVNAILSNQTPALIELSDRVDTL